MSTFAEKSNQSLDSARLLASNHLYASTVNRSYYACFQYIMHILIEKLKKDHSQFYAEVRQRNTGTHGWASKLIMNELAQKKIDRNDYKWFQKKYPSILDLRIEADYYPGTISQELGADSITQAESIIRFLAQTFKS